MTTFTAASVDGADKNKADFPMQKISASTKARMVKIGIGLVTKKTEYKTNVRIEFPLPDNSTFNVIGNLKALFHTLKLYDKELIVVPNQSDGQPFADEASFPKNETEIKRYFPVIDEKTNTANKSIVYSATLRTKETIGNIKFSNPTLLSWLKNNSVYIKADRFNKRPTASTGHILQLHPDATNRDNLKEMIDSAIRDVAMTLNEKQQLNPDIQITENNMEDDYYPEFDILPGNVGYGFGQERITTRALEITTTKADGLLLKELISRSNLKEYIPDAIFLPRGFLQMASPEAYKKLLSDHNAKLQQIEIIPIFGLLPNAVELSYNIKEPDGTINECNIEQEIESSDYITSLEPTVRSGDLGKYLLVTTKKDAAAARAFIDDMLPKIFDEHIPDNSNYRLDGYHHPRRPGIRHNSGIKNYAAQLARSVGSTTSFIQHAPRNTKRATPNYVYTETEFPPLNANKKTRFSTSDNNSVITNATNSMTSTELKETILNEIRSEIKELVRNEVRETMQATIKETLREVIPTERFQKLDNLEYNVSLNNNKLNSITANIEQMTALLRHMQPMQQQHFQGRFSTPMSPPHGFQQPMSPPPNYHATQPQTQEMGQPNYQQQYQGQSFQQQHNNQDEVYENNIPTTQPTSPGNSAGPQT